MAFLHVVFLAALCAGVIADDVKFSACPDVSSDACQVSALRITPCNKMKNGNCRIVKGNSVALSFDYTTTFQAQNLNTTVVHPSPIGDLSFESFGSHDGCEYTPCPVEANQEKTYNYNLKLSKKLPNGIYPIEWSLWNNDDESQKCCFKITIRLAK